LFSTIHFKATEEQTPSKLFQSQTGGTAALRSGIARLSKKEEEDPGGP